MSSNEIQLPKDVIQHIQSFLDGREAFRTAILSKLWYDAWLTRPAIDLYVECGPTSCRRGQFYDYAAATMKRYADSNLKIDSFSLRFNTQSDAILTRGLISDALGNGATDLTLSLRGGTLPPLVLSSETLTRLSIDCCNFQDNYRVSCSNLKSLTLGSVNLTGDVFGNILSSCLDSIEELSLYREVLRCSTLSRRPNLCELHESYEEWIWPYEQRLYYQSFTLSRWNPRELRKLKRLSLDRVIVDETFFADFNTRFPCLNELSLLLCHCNRDDEFGSRQISVASTSLHYIHLESPGHCRFRFDVPNIRKFKLTCRYFYVSSDDLSIETPATREWEFDLSIPLYCRYEYLLSLKAFLTKFRSSRLSLSFSRRLYAGEPDLDVAVTSLAGCVVLENLKMNPPFESCWKDLANLFGICRPKFITYSPTNKQNVGKLVENFQRKHVFKKFGIKVVNVEFFEKFGTGWRPFLLKDGPIDSTNKHKQKVRLELRWGEVEEALC